jgi:hypothetical protein
MAFVAVGAGIATAATSYGLSQLGSSGGGGGGGGGGTGYIPTAQPAADQYYQNAMAGQQGNMAAVQGVAPGAYQQSLQQQNAINYAPYQAAANQAGQIYGQQSAQEMANAGKFGQQAQQSGTQAAALYGAGNQMYQAGFDPQNTLRAQNQQILSDQINAGQAQRGLGNSPVGGSEYNQGMQNFDTQWTNNQLSREQAGIAGMAQANQAGGAQSTLQGTALNSQTQALGNAGGAMMQSGQIPLNAQMFVAGQPAANASSYANEMGALNNMYANQGQTAGAYMGIGQAGQQVAFNQGQQNYQNQQAQLGGALNLGGQAYSAMNNNQNSGSNNFFSGLSNAFGGGQQAAAPVTGNFAGVGPLQSFQGQG